VLSRQVRELNLTPANELVFLGQQILGSPVKWRLESSEASLFWLKSYFPEGELSKRRWFGAMTELSNYSGLNSLSRSSDGLAFALEFRLKNAWLGEQEEFKSSYFDHASFWLAFYADQREAIHRLQPEGAHLWEDPDRIFYDWEYRYWREPLRLVDFTNLASAYLLTSGVQENQAIFKIFLQGFYHWYRQTESGVSPLELFFTNQLAWAFQRDEKWAVELALQKIKEDQSIVERLTPFIKIVV
jgi:hypothetical protein